MPLKDHRPVRYERLFIRGICAVLVCFVILVVVLSVKAGADLIGLTIGWDVAILILTCVAGLAVAEAVFGRRSDTRSGKGNEDDV